MKTFNIISADIITKTGTEPFVGLTVNVNGQQQQIARTCKQALLDLHKSARASNIPSGLFDNGVASANPLLYNKFRESIIGLVGKVGVADVDFYEAGAEYEATEVSSAVKAGIAKVGDILKTEKKGSRVEGFMSFPLTNAELARREMIESINPTTLLQALLGIEAPVVGGTGSDLGTGSDTSIKKEGMPAENNTDALGTFNASDFPAPDGEMLEGGASVEEVVEFEITEATKESNKPARK